MNDSGGHIIDELSQKVKSWEQYYLVKTPFWLKKIYPGYVWNIETREKVLYLSFDDGPHPVITPFILQVLRMFAAGATFFCVGKNVVRYPEIYKQILDEGHSVGNHTYNHLNGWNTDNETYLKDVLAASKIIDSKLFRPCYGRITRFQAKNLRPVMNGKEPIIVMWDVLSGDFDTRCSPQQCLSNVVLSSVPGSIIVFHDSEKAFQRLEYALPRMLRYFADKGYSFRPIEE